MEEELDEIAEGKATRVGVLRDFYMPFSESLTLAEEKFERYLEELDELCPKCPTEGREPGRLQVRLGRFGKFIGCDNFPECDTSATSTAASGRSPSSWTRRARVRATLVKKVGRFGPFVGCSGYPDCRYIEKSRPRARGRARVRAGRAGREADAVRADVRVRSVPRVRLRDEQPAREGRPVPRVRRSAAADQELAVLALRRRDGSRPEGHEARRSRGGGRGARGQGRGAQGARGARAAKKPTSPKKTAAKTKMAAGKKTAAKKPAAKTKTAAKKTTAKERTPKESIGRRGLGAGGVPSDGMADVSAAATIESPFRQARKARSVASVADQVAALRGTRSATLKDLLTHPPFARLLAAMSVSSWATGSGSSRSLRSWRTSREAGSQRTQSPA